MVSFREMVRETFAITLSLALLPIFLLLLAITYFCESDEEAAKNSYDKVLT